MFLFDFHSHASDFWHPDTPHLFKNFRDEPDARLYLQALQKELPNVLGEFRPEAGFYAAAWTCSQEPRTLRCVFASRTSRGGKPLCLRRYRVGRCRLLTSSLADMPASRLWQRFI